MSELGDVYELIDDDDELAQQGQQGQQGAAR